MFSDSMHRVRSVKMACMQLPRNILIIFVLSLYEYICRLTITLTVILLHVELLSNCQNKTFIIWLFLCRQVPLELLRQARGGEVDLQMEDHRGEDFVPPKVKPKAFTGAGHMLGR